jgi:hypothetical protein
VSAGEGGVWVTQPAEKELSPLLHCKLKAIDAFRLPRKGDTPFLEPSPAQQENK